MSKFLVLILLILLSLLMACASSNTALARDISQELFCQCGGCTDVLSDCQCDTANRMKASIEKKLSLRQSKEQILRTFADSYGPQVLVDP